MSHVVTRGLGARTLVVQGYGSDGDVPPDVGPSFDPLNPARDLLRRGIRWANVPRGNPANVSRNGTRVEHVNVTMNVLQDHSEKGGLSGVIRYRFRALPSSIVGESRNRDRFGNPIYPFTGS